MLLIFPTLLKTTLLEKQVRNSFLRQASYDSETLYYLDFMNTSIGLTQILMEVSLCICVDFSLRTLLSSDKSSQKYLQVRSFSLCEFLDISWEIFGTGELEASDKMQPPHAGEKIHCSLICMRK